MVKQLAVNDEYDVYDVIVWQKYVFTTVHMKRKNGVFKKKIKQRLMNMKSLASTCTKVWVYDRPQDVETAFSILSTLESVFESMCLG